MLSHTTRYQLIDKVVNMKQMPQTIIVDLNPHYGLISITGPDKETFLQGQLTVDIREILSTKHNLSAYCNLKGRINALFRIFFHHDSYYLQLPLSILSRTVTELKKYAKFSKVAIQDLSTDWQRLGISIISDNKNPENWILPKTLLQLDPKIQIMQPGDTLNLSDMILLCLTGPSPRFELLGPATTIKPFWKQFSNEAEIRDFNEWKLLDIKMGIPEVWPETIEHFLPHSLNLPALKAVSFNKGCYRGQEIIARMEYRAKIKRHLAYASLRSDIIPPPGTPLHSEDAASQDIGSVVSASFASNNTVEMLIEILDEFAQNHPLYIELQDKRFSLFL